MVSELGTRYKTADAERLDLKRLVADAQSSRIQLGDAINKHKALEDAHLIQSKFIHKLQKKLSKVDTYTETIEMQEKVIMKMQSVIESCAPERNKKAKNKKSESDPTLSNSGKSNTDDNSKNVENDFSRDKIEKNIRDEYRKRIDELVSTVRFLF